MESFVQALGGVELNAGSFLHLENFFTNFLVFGLGNVATLKIYLSGTSQRRKHTSLQCRDVENRPLYNVATLDSNVATLK